MIIKTRRMIWYEITFSFLINQTLLGIFQSDGHKFLDKTVLLFYPIGGSLWKGKNRFHNPWYSKWGSRPFIGWPKRNSSVEKRNLLMFCSKKSWRILNVKNFSKVYNTMFRLRTLYHMKLSRRRHGSSPYTSSRATIYVPGEVAMTINVKIRVTNYFLLIRAF